jgi:hypothetical protein
MLFHKFNVWGTHKILDIDRRANMKIHIDAFALGASDYLKEKRASSNIFDIGMNENILPTFNSQKNWRYVQTPEGLKLSDGERVYGFDLKDFGGEMSGVEKMNDVPLLDFEAGKVRGGTAQVHRASPDSLYLTLANGIDNPTFRLEHDEGKKWKYIPSKKMIQRLEQLKSHGDQKGPEGVSTPKVDLDSLMQGGMDQLKTAGAGEFLFGKGLSSVANPQARGLATDLALYSNPFTGVATGLYDTGSHLMNGRVFSALGSLGMGALSFIPGAGSVARGALSLGGKGVSALVNAGSKGLASLGGKGKALANTLDTGVQRAGDGVAKAVNSPMGQRINEGAQNFAERGKIQIDNAVNKLVQRGQQIVPQKYERWEHGFQNPLKNMGEGGGLRSPFSSDFNLGTNLRSGVDMAIKNPLGTSQFLHSYGGGAPDEAIYKASSFDGFFGSASGAANAINSGIEGVKNVVGNSLGAAAQNPGTTVALAVGGGITLNKLREAVSRKHRENMENHPEKRFNREVAIPALGGLGLAAMGDTLT